MSPTGGVNNKPVSWQHAVVVLSGAYIFKNFETVTATQRAFSTPFGLVSNESVPNRKTILKCVLNLRTLGSENPKK